MGWSAAKAEDEAVAAARDRAAMARMVRGLLLGMVCLLGRALGDAPCGFGSGSLGLEVGRPGARGLSGSERTKSR